MTENEQLIDVIDDQRSRLYRQLMRCNLQDDETAANLLRSVIDALSKTIELLTKDEITIDDVHAFGVRIHIPQHLFFEPTSISFWFQQKSSHPLPLHHYFEVISPRGESRFSPQVIQRNQLFSFQCEFEMGLVSDAELKEFDVLIRMWHKCPSVSVKRNEIIGIATVPLRPLVQVSHFNRNLRFMTLKGIVTEFTFRFVIRRPGKEEFFVEETVYCAEEVIHKQGIPILQYHAQ
jgi:hypothetical protein